MKSNAPSRFTQRRTVGDGSASGPSWPGAGPAEEFKRLILPHLDGAYNLARYLTRNPAHSEDVVQDAILRAFRAFGQFRGPSPRAWLFAIVRNCCRTVPAATAGGVSLVVNESGLSADAERQVRNQPDPQPTPEEAALRNAEIESVRAAIEAIPEPFRETIVLRDLEDLSYAEVAEVTGVPVGTVMSRLSRGRSMLAQELLPSRVSSDEQSRSTN